jgi:hypothetical protein
MPSVDAGASPARSYLYYRHALPVRLMHWTNVVALTILFMSGLQIFNAHPALYWAGKSSYTGVPPVLEMGARQAGESRYVGYTRIFGREFDTTGRARLSKSADGRLAARGFPWWITIPDDPWLAMARSCTSSSPGAAHQRLAVCRVLACQPPPVRDHRAGSPRLALDRPVHPDHLRFRHPSGDEAKRYNVLQKLTYLAGIFVLLPLIILLGLAMSPWLNTCWPDGGSLRAAAGGRARFTSSPRAARRFRRDSRVRGDRVGLWNHLRSMITGRYRIVEERHEPSA